MSRQDWYMEKINELSKDESVIPTLNEIKEHFSELPTDEATQIAKTFELPVVFDCLNNSNPDQINVACELLSLCMSKLTLGESIDRYGTPLERSLNHPLPSVKLMALKEIHRNALDENIHCQLCRKQNLLNNVINCFGDNDLGVVREASDVVLLLGTSQNGIRQLVSPDMLNTIAKTMIVNEVVKMRFYEVFVNIAAKSEGSLKLLESTGIIPQILSDLDNKDVLLKMNVIEILIQMLATQHGFDYLESKGVFQKLLQHFNDDSDSLTFQLCEPGILRFYGHMAYWKPLDVLQKYQLPFNRLLSNLESSDFTLFGVSVDVIGHIGEKNDGKMALDAIEDRTLRVIQILRERMGSLPNEAKLRAMACLESLIRIKEPNEIISNLARKWFDKLGNDAMDFIFHYAKNPFSEIRLGGLGLINALCSHHWGQELIKNTPGLIEFLMDRRIETMKDCKEAIFEIIILLASSPVFDKMTQLKLQTFIREGPFYVQTVNEVAIEGD